MISLPGTITGAGISVNPVCNNKVYGLAQVVFFSFFCLQKWYAAVKESLSITQVFPLRNMIEIALCGRKLFEPREKLRDTLI